MTKILIQNGCLLITLSFLYTIIRWYRPKNDILFRLISGIWFGLSAIAAMMIPFEYSDGIILDGRSVVLTLSGLWGGGLTTVISIAVAGLFRLYIGGAGQWVGSGIIIFCGIVGLVFRRICEGKLTELKVIELFGIGIVSHLVMLFLLLFLPISSISMFSTVSPSVIITLPIAFVFIARLFQQTERYFNQNQKIKEAEEFYRTTLLSIGDAVICTDDKGNVNQMNTVAEKLTGWKFHEVKGSDLADIFNIINEDNRQEVESPFTKVMREGTVVGLANHTMLISKSGEEIPIADSGAPIFSKNKIVGVVLVFRDQSEEKKHQKMLTESEAMYRERAFWLNESQRVGRIGSYDLDIQNNNWTSSEVLDEILGMAVDSTHDFESWLAVVHPNHRDEMFEYFTDDVLKQKKEFEKEYKILRKTDGIERWVLGHGELFINESGEPVRMFGTIQDITDRKIFELQLKESEERFRKAVLSSPIPIMVHDEDGQVMTISEGWHYFSGYAIEDIPTLAEWTKKAYGQKATEIEAYVNSIFKEKETVRSGEYEINAKSGENRIWNFYDTPLGLNGDKKIMLSMAPDVTHRIKMKEQLEESELAYRLLFEEHTAAKFLIDPETGKIVKANKAASLFYGWSIEELESMNIAAINTLSEVELNEAIAFAHLNKRIYFEFKHCLANGEVRDVEVFSSKTEYKRKILLHSIVHDVTGKKQLMSELVNAKEKAEESDKLKSAFLANMSHEIRTPLNGIVGFANLLTENDLADFERRDYIRIINESSENLLKIVSDILDISKLDSGNPVIEKKPCDINKILSSVNSIFQKKLENTGNDKIKLIAKLAPKKLILNVDETRLIQIFSNLLDNAIRFTSYGSVNFGISRIEPHLVEFFVADTGIGIPQEKQHIIFERFTQADMGLKRSYGGVGLGLAIVKKLVELLGGEIALQSETGCGSSFFFEIPNQQAQIEGLRNENQRIDIQYLSTVPLDKETKILIVEDDYVSRLYLERILKKRFEKLFFAETGEKAFNSYKTEVPDIILMDIRLPDTSGLEVVKKIRENDLNVKIIAQTAYAMNEDEQNSLQAGCNDFITKPVDRESLFNKLNGNSIKRLLNEAESQ